MQLPMQGWFCSDPHEFSKHLVCAVPIHESIIYLLALLSQQCSKSPMQPTEIRHKAGNTLVFTVNVLLWERPDLEAVITGNIIVTNVYTEVSYCAEVATLNPSSSYLSFNYLNWDQKCTRSLFLHSKGAANVRLFSTKQKQVLKWRWTCCLPDVVKVLFILISVEDWERQHPACDDLCLLQQLV